MNLKDLEREILEIRVLKLLMKTELKRFDAEFRYLPTRDYQQLAREIVAECREWII